MATTGQCETRAERIARLKRQIRPGFAELASRVTEENRETLEILEEYDRRGPSANGTARSPSNSKP